MPAGLSQTAVIDTADLRLVVPMRTPLNLTGSRLFGTLTAAFGGPPAAELDSADGSISWVADNQGLTRALIAKVAKVTRGDWRASGLGGQAAPVTIVLDVHRAVAGSDADEWLGRTSVLVLPASDSDLVLAGPSTQPILISRQPEGGILLPALQIGPQGPGIALPDGYDPIADAGKTFGIRVIGGVLTLVVLDGAVTPPDPGDGSAPFFTTQLFPLLLC